MRFVLMMLLLLLGSVSSFGEMKLSNVTIYSGYPWKEIAIGYKITGTPSGPGHRRIKVLATAEWALREKSTYTAVLTDKSEDLLEGHHIVLCKGLPGLKNYNVTFTLQLEDCMYCVVDLSDGVDAERYPVSYLEDVPTGGWTDEYKTTKLVLRRIEPGSFMMGGDVNDTNGARQITRGTNEVVISKQFYIGVFEVTQRQYELVMGTNPCKDFWETYNDNPSALINDVFPVRNISWNMARGDSSTYDFPKVRTVSPDSFVGRLQTKTGLCFDLPTEAQWEYACRAGTTTLFNNGTDNYAGLLDYSGSCAHPVGLYPANDWGIYDMHANVEEWCLDWFGELKPGQDPEGPLTGTERVRRGIDLWANNPNAFTSHVRQGDLPASRYRRFYFINLWVDLYRYGFRVAMTHK